MKEKTRYGKEKLFIGPRFGDEVNWGKKTTAFVDDTGITWVKVIEGNGEEGKSTKVNTRRNGRNGKADPLPLKESPLK